ncbi:MAG TPA: N-acyl homoserine lactonase family protein, partial [Sphingomicrobium sp.]|nr:N-acyl homoserine lactonase family protein [Sphingomicrobium sp.]
ADINFVGISHYHDDHTGQAADFPGATLLMGKGDWDAVKGRPPTAARFKPWIEGGSKVEPVAGDKDVFGDKKVMILDMPGHTPGHKALLVRLASGPVLLTGDLYHATEQVANRGVPSFNTNRADTLASFDRFQAIARSLKAKVIIQHEASDIAKLPAFPKAAE